VDHARSDVGGASLGIRPEDHHIDDGRQFDQHLNWIPTDRRAVDLQRAVGLTDRALTAGRQAARFGGPAAL
jgi:hypothetical protein